MTTTDCSLISVIIPVYNVEKYLSQCLDSVIAQTYQNLEILIINDGSTDNSGKICDEYAAKDKRIKVLHQTNKGLSAARNVGLKVAQGEYIGFVDGDDYIEPNMYEYLYHLITQDNASVAMCNACGDEGFHSGHPIKDTYKLIPFLDIFSWDDWAFVWNKLYLRKFVSNITFNVTTSFGEDALFNFELAKTNALVALGGQSVYHYRFRKNLFSLSCIFKPTHLNILVLMEESLQYAQEHGLTVYYKTRLATNLMWVYHWLLKVFLSSQPDLASAKILRRHLRKHLIFFWRLGRFSLRSKVLVTIACINFNLARKIYLSLRKLRGQQ